MATITKCDLCENPVEYKIVVSEAKNKLTKQTIELCIEHIAEYKEFMRRFTRGVLDMADLPIEENV